MKGWLWALWLALLLSLGLNIGFFAVGLERQRSRPARPPERSVEESVGRLERAAAHLGLEGEAAEAFVEVQRRFIRTVLEERRGLERLRSEVRLEVQAETPDRERLGRLLEESAAVYRALDGAFVDNILESRRYLDAEQERMFLGYLGRLRSQAVGR